MSDGIALNMFNQGSLNNNRRIGPERHSIKSSLPKHKEKKLKKACEDFEAIFINMMLKQMRKTVPESKILGGSREEKIFREMMDEKLSEEMSQSKALGIAQILYNQIRVNPK